MRRRTLNLIIAGAVIVAVLIVGVVVAAAQGPTSLPSITVSQLLRNVATRAQGTTAVSGDVAWSNDLLGSSSLLSLGNQTPSGLSSFLSSGSGRVWAQDGKVRLESQGQNGDFVVVDNGLTVWTWNSTTTTATQYRFATGMRVRGASPSPGTTVDPATAIGRLITRLAPTARLSVGGQTTVAGRRVYTLVLTPASPITAFGSVRVAIDGHRWVPLRVQVFAKGDTTAVLSAGFKTVSFGKSSASLFTFTPPSGATVVHKTVKAPAGLGAAGAEKVRGSGAAVSAKPLSLTQAKARAPFLLTPSSTPAGLSLRGAFVTPSASASAKAAATLTPEQRGMLTALGKHPAAALVYGSGFGSVVVIEARTTPAQDAQLQQRLGSLSAIGRSTVGGAPAIKLQTPLGTVVTFRRGGVRVVVAGLVPWSTIDRIAGSLR